MAQIQVYTTQYCGYCTRAKAFLKEKGIPFEEIDVTGDDQARAELLEKSGGKRTVPQIFINNQPIGGYTDLIILAESGKLEQMLS